MWVEFTDKTMDTTANIIRILNEDLEKNESWVEEVISSKPGNKVLVAEREKYKDKICAYKRVIDGKPVYCFVYYGIVYDRDGNAHGMTRVSKEFSFENNQISFIDEKVGVSCCCMLATQAVVNQWDEYWKRPQYLERFLIFDDGNEIIYIERRKNGYVFVYYKDGEMKETYPFYLRMWL